MPTNTDAEIYSTDNLGKLALRISDHVTAMLAYWDKDQLCRYANSAYADWFGKKKEDMINRITLAGLLGPLYEKNLPYIKAVLTGKKQLFEREIPIPGGSGTRHSLATYIPDIKNGEVKGFFVHVADVTYLKNLEKEIADTKRQVLRNAIETEENIKRYLVDILRESINQRLAACIMIIKKEEIKAANHHLFKDVGLHIGEIIREINLLCQDLTPTEIEILGLIEAVELYLAKSAELHHAVIDYVCDDDSIETILLKDKYSVYRIIQNFITLIFNSGGTTKIEVSIKYAAPAVTIQLIVDGKIVLDNYSKEYNAIACRVDYYKGTTMEVITEWQSVFTIEFPLTGIA